MTRFLKSVMLVVAGLCWIAFAALSGLVLFQYLIGGAGLQVFGFFFGVSSTSVLVGLVHFMGFTAGSCLCFVIGVGLCAHGFIPAQEKCRDKSPDKHC